VDEAIKESYNTLNIKMLEGCTRDQLLFMAAIHLESTFSGQSDVILHAVFDRLNTTFLGYKTSLPNVLENISILSTCRLIVCDGLSNRLSTKLAINVGHDDLSFVMKARNCPQLEDVASRLQ
jgi:hypothetical protein